MKNLTTAIFAKCAVGTALYTALGGRLYKQRAPEGTAYPYAIFFVVSDRADPVFAKGGEDVRVQFSLFSSASSSGDIEDAYTACKALYDDCSLTITGTTLVWMQRESASLMLEEHTTPTGTMEVWHYVVEYRVLTQEA